MADSRRRSFTGVTGVDTDGVPDEWLEFRNSRMPGGFASVEVCWNMRDKVTLEQTEDGTLMVRMPWLAGGQPPDQGVARVTIWTSLARQQPVRQNKAKP